MQKARYAYLLMLFLLSSCSSGSDCPCPEICSVSEAFITERSTDLNLDSIAVWHGTAEQHWLIATAKSANVLPVYDAATGVFIKNIGEPGVGLGQLQRPNGIAVSGDLLFIVERENKRLQIFSLPDGKPLGMTAGVLQKPYGIAVMQNNPKEYIAYVTDDYSASKKQASPKKIYRYVIKEQAGKISIDLLDSFGDQEGAGALLKVESIVADKKYNRLIIADEYKRQRNLKIYTLDGKFTGKIVGEGLFMHDPEGVALYETGPETGYIIATDQDFSANRFYLFDRKTLHHVATIKGASASNTDGIAVSDTPFGPFPAGAFYAVSDDGNICAYDWKTIVKKCKI